MCIGVGFEFWVSKAYWHTLQKTNIKLELVPFDRRALDAHKGQRDRRLPFVRRLEDEVVERLADLAVIATRPPAVSCVCIR